MTKPQLSASSLTTFLRCGHQWFLAYVEGHRAPPSLAQARGIAVHKAVEYNMAQKVQSHEDVPLDEMRDAFSDSWEQELEDGFQPDEEKTPGDVKDDGIALTTLHHKEVSPIIQPIWVEKPIQFDINGIVWSGQIDVADEMGRVRDTKTTGRKPNPESYLLGMTGYAVAQRQLTGQVETDTVFDYLIATKTQQRYLPISAGGPVTDDQIIRFANTVEQVASSIEKGSFAPTGLQNRGVCGWCGFKSICRYYMKGGSDD